MPARPASRRPGRPLDPEADRVILETTKDLLGELGFARLTIEAVAARAGVARTTVYRRYRDKTELVLAAIEAMRSVILPEPTGDARADLVRLLDTARQRIDPALAGTMLIEQSIHPELVETFRTRVVLPMRANFERIIESGIAASQVRRDADVDAAVDALLGSFFARVLTEGRPKSGWAERIVAVLWQDLHA